MLVLLMFLYNFFFYSWWIFIFEFWIFLSIYFKLFLTLKKNLGKNKFIFKMQIILFKSRFGHHKFFIRLGILCGEWCTIPWVREARPILNIVLILSKLSELEIKESKKTKFMKRDVTGRTWGIERQWCLLYKCVERIKILGINIKLGL